MNIDIRVDGNLFIGGYAIMTAYEIITVNLAILTIVGSLLGIIVTLIIALINAKK